MSSIYKVVGSLRSLTFYYFGKQNICLYNDGFRKKKQRWEGNLKYFCFIITTSTEVVAKKFEVANRNDGDVVAH